MKKFFLLVMVLALITIGITGADAADKEKIDVYEQQELVKSIVFVIGEDRYFINNDTKGVKMDVAPFIEQGRTFVPIRYLGYALGLVENDIVWDGNSQKVTMKGITNTVELVVGSKTITSMPNDNLSDRSRNTMDVSPILKPTGRTFLPARYVAEALGYEVGWDEDGYVIVWPKGEEQPDIISIKEEIGDKPQQQDKETTKINGYEIPKKTDLDITTHTEEGYSEISILYFTTCPSEPQLQDIFTIISSKFGDRVAQEVKDYIGKKKVRSDVLQFKEWPANGKYIQVSSSNKVQYSVNIQVADTSLGSVMVND